VVSTKHVLGEFQGDLEQAATPEACMAVMRTRVGHLGFRNVVYGHTPNPRDIDGPLMPYQRYSSIPERWEKRYREMNYQNHCQIYRQCLRRGTLPLVWHEIWERFGLDETQIRMLDEAEQCGVTFGISVPIYERGRGDFFGAGISTDADEAEARELIDRSLAPIFQMAHHLHQAMTGLGVGMPPAAVTEKLTMREWECLRWVADGKSTWDISEIESITENTVKFHLRNVLKKLGVSTRAAAVAKAFRLGILDL
jgi:DNA-binding CsgD family transcriptional regulator